MEDPAEPAHYDHDWTVVLDDWIDGTGYTPDQVLDALRNGMGGMSMATSCWYVAVNSTLTSCAPMQRDTTASMASTGSRSLPSAMPASMNSLSKRR